MINNEYTLTVDIKRKHTAIVPTFVQNDTAILLFKIFDNGKPYDISGVERVEVTHKRKDGQVVIGLATFEVIDGESVIRYEYMGNEMSRAGFAETSITLFAGATRVSIQPFKINIISDIRDAIGATQEFGLLQDMIVNVHEVSNNTIQATEEALAVKVATESVRVATDTVKTETEAVRVATNIVKGNTETVRVATEAVRVATDIVKTATNTVKNATEQVRLDTVAAKDATILATTDAKTASQQSTQATTNAQLVADNTRYVEDYNVATQYKKNNFVSFGGSTYMAKLDSKGIAPPTLPAASNANWVLSGRKGADGTGTVAVHRDEFTATANQKIFTLSKTYDQFQNRISVTVGGVPQFSPDNFTEASSSTISFSEGVPLGVKVIVEYFSEAVPLSTDAGTTIANHTNLLSTHSQKITTAEADLVSVNQALADTANQMSINISLPPYNVGAGGDATQAIKDALATLPRASGSGYNGGGTIYIPFNCVISSTITINNHGVKIVGYSPVKTLITPSDTFSGDVIFDFVADGWAYIRDIGVSNLGFNMNNKSGIHAIRANKPYDLCIFEKLYFLNVHGSAIRLENRGAGLLGQGNVIRDIMVDNKSKLLGNATEPIVFLENQNETIFQGNKLFGDDPGTTTKPNRNGLKIAGCQGVNIKASSFTIFNSPAISIETATTGMQIRSMYIFIDGNTFEELGGSAVSVDGGSLVNKVEHVVIGENRYLGAQAAFKIILDNCDFTIVKERVTAQVKSGNALNTYFTNNVIGNVTDSGTQTVITGRGVGQHEFSANMVINKNTPQFTMQTPTGDKKINAFWNYAGTTDYGWYLRYINGGTTLNVLKLEYNVLGTDVTFKPVRLSLPTLTSLPTADAGNRGLLARVEGGAGVADATYISRKKADDTYEWKQIDI